MIADVKSLSCTKSGRVGTSKESRSASPEQVSEGGSRECVDGFFVEGCFHFAILVVRNLVIDTDPAFATRD